MDGRCVRLMVAALVGSMLLGVGPTAEAQNEPTRSIEHIAGDVYYYHYDEGMRGGRSFLWNGLFMVTPEGIILVDPIGMAERPVAQGGTQAPVRPGRQDHHL